MADLYAEMLRPKSSLSLAMRKCDKTVPSSKARELKIRSIAQGSV